MCTKSIKDVYATQTETDDDPVVFTRIPIKISINISLSLFKINALNAALVVPLRVVQKFIKKKEVNPISSQPKNSKKQLSAITKRDIVIINQFKHNINRSQLGSFLK